MATQYAEGFEPIEAPSYVEGFEPIEDNVPRGTISPREQFIANYIASEQRPALSQAASAAAVPFQIGGEMLRTLGGGAEALGEVMGRSTLPSTVEQPLSQRIAESLSTSLSRSALPLLPSAITDTIGRAIPQVVQAGVEGGARSLFGLGNAINQAVRFASDEPLSLPTNLTPGGLVQSLIQSLSPRTPTREEAERAFGRQESAQQAASVLAEPLVPEILGETSIPLAEGMRTVAELAPGAPLALSTTARALTSVGRGAGRVATFPARALTRSTATAEQSGITALGLSSSEVQEILPIAVPRIVQTAGKVPATTGMAEELLKITPKTRQALFNEATQGLGVSQRQGLTIKGNSAADAAIQAIESNSRFLLDNPQEAERLISKYQKYRKEYQALDGRKLLEDTNQGLRSHYSKTAKGQASDMTDAELRAEKAFALNLGDQVDDLVKFGSGKDISPYSDIGKIIEFERALDISLEGAKQLFASRVARIRQTGERLPTTKTQAVTQAGRGVTTAFRNTEVENLNKQLGNVFKGTPKRVTQPNLPKQSLDVISQRYAKGKPSLTPPVIEEVVIPTLESQIQDLIKTYPANIQRNPALARTVAETELGQGRFVEPQ